MTELSLGGVLHEKAANMTAWLHAEGLSVVMPLNILALTTFAHTLHNEYDDTIKARDFAGLRVDKENLPLEGMQVVDFVEVRAPLHDKFWRYLTLFSEVASMHG